MEKIIKEKNGFYTSLIQREISYTQYYCGYVLVENPNIKIKEGDFIGEEITFLSSYEILKKAFSEEEAIKKLKRYITELFSEKILSNVDLKKVRVVGFDTAHLRHMELGLSNNLSYADDCLEELTKELLKQISFDY